MEDLERICHNFDMSSKDIIYFSVNNWDCGMHYPDEMVFDSQSLAERFVKEFLID